LHVSSAHPATPVFTFDFLLFTFDLHFTHSTVAWYQLESMSGHPKVGALPDDRHARQIKEWGDQPKQRQAPSDPPKRLEPVKQAVAPRKQEVHLFKEPAWIESWLLRREIPSLSGIQISQPVQPIQAPKQIDRFHAESALAVVQHLGAGVSPGGGLSGCRS
jgi:hypothetical protein